MRPHPARQIGGLVNTYRTNPSTRSRFVAAAVAYAVVVATGVSLVNALDPAPTWVGALVAMAAAVPGLGMILMGPMRLRRQDGLERSILLAATSVAFFVTMAASMTYGLLEAFADAPKPSAWWVYSFGMIAWLVSSVVMQRRMT
jgi:hypothetical protein